TWFRSSMSWYLPEPKSGFGGRCAGRSRLASGGRSGPDLLEICLDERVQLAIHDGVDIAVLELGPVVVHHRVRLEHVRPDLVAPSDVRLGRLPLGASTLLLLQGTLVQPGPEHLHGGRAVLVLRALLLARHHYRGRLVRDAYGGVRLVDVLAARARGPVGVDT